MVLIKIHRHSFQGQKEHDTDCEENYRKQEEGDADNVLHWDVDGVLKVVIVCRCTPLYPE